MANIKESDIGTVLELSPNMRVPYYLMLSYLYYKRDISIVSDAFFDNLAKEILRDYESITHYHKHLITKDMLEAGTYLGEYPTIVCDSSEMMFKNGLKDTIKRLRDSKRMRSALKPAASLENFFT